MAWGSFIVKMFGMGGMDPKKMQAVMKKMGINQEEIHASEVIIKKDSGDEILIQNPSVTKIIMQGQESFQISGEILEKLGSFEEDIKIIIEKTNATEKQAKAALEKTGDLAEAILELSK